jgi:hypothetical protein
MIMSDEAAFRTDDMPYMIILAAFRNTDEQFVCLMIAVEFLLHPL